MKQGMIFWFSGLSGAGKTTLAESVREGLNKQNIKTSILDGDDVRNRLHKHLGFSEADIKENNTLIARLCAEERKLVDVIMVPIISPYARSRAMARDQLSPGFFEIHVHAGIAELEKRDTKGLYAKARNGEMDNLIGYSSNATYEVPKTPDLAINTELTHIDDSIKELFDFTLYQLS